MEDGTGAVSVGVDEVLFVEPSDPGGCSSWDVFVEEVRELLGSERNGRLPISKFQVKWRAKHGTDLNFDLRDAIRAGMVKGVVANGEMVGLGAPKQKLRAPLGGCHSWAEFSVKLQRVLLSHKAAITESAVGTRWREWFGVRIGKSLAQAVKEGLITGVHVENDIYSVEPAKAEQRQADAEPAPATNAAEPSQPDFGPLPAGCASWSQFCSNLKAILAAGGRRLTIDRVRRLWELEYGFPLITKFEYMERLLKHGMLPGIVFKNRTLILSAGPTPPVEPPQWDAIAAKIQEMLREHNGRFPARKLSALWEKKHGGPFEHVASGNSLLSCAKEGLLPGVVCEGLYVALATAKKGPTGGGNDKRRSKRVRNGKNVANRVKKGASKTAKSADTDAQAAAASVGSDAQGPAASPVKRSASDAGLEEGDVQSKKRSA